jgi:hypothetical protein
MNRPGDGEVSPFTGGSALQRDDVERKKRRVALARKNLLSLGFSTLNDYATKRPGDIAAGDPFTQLPLWTKI